MPAYNLRGSVPPTSLRTTAVKASTHDTQEVIHLRKRKLPLLVAPLILLLTKCNSPKIENARKRYEAKKLNDILTLD